MALARAGWGRVLSGRHGWTEFGAVRVASSFKAWAGHAPYSVATPEKPRYRKVRQAGNFLHSLRACKLRQMTAAATRRAEPLAGTGLSSAKLRVPLSVLLQSRSPSAKIETLSVSSRVCPIRALFLAWRFLVSLCLARSVLSVPVRLFRVV